jgi:hypothetical protein
MHVEMSAEEGSSVIKNTLDIGTHKTVGISRSWQRKEIVVLQVVVISGTN